ncbi:hypothetical protein ACFQ3Z_02705 [Streptomyces nogalater]
MPDTEQARIREAALPLTDPGSLDPCWTASAMSATSCWARRPTAPPTTTGSVAR